jgi:serine/threonine protein kinase
MATFPPSEGLIGTTLGSYYLERLIGRNELGPVFLGTTDQGGRYLVRFITAPAALGPEERGMYQEQFLQVAGAVAALQHRHILPLLDYGSYLGGSYLVTPDLPMQTLISAITKSGPPDLETVERYLDEITQGLEYAHSQGIVHRNLSTDCIFILRDGRLVIGDFGVMHLLELVQPPDPRQGRSYPDYGSGEGRAPEQLLEGVSTPATDVYALGAILYRLLTAHAVFRHREREGVYEQHLRTAVTPLERWRGDLPAELNEVIRCAMEKDPRRRFQHPQAVVNAYRAVMAGMHYQELGGARARVAESPAQGGLEAQLEEASRPSRPSASQRAASRWRALLTRLRRRQGASEP